MLSSEPPERAERSAGVGGRCGVHIRERHGRRRNHPPAGRNGRETDSAALRGIQQCGPDGGRTPRGVGGEGARLLSPCGGGTRGGADAVAEPQNPPCLLAHARR